MTAAELAEQLNGRRVGSGRWIAKCPGHRDRSPSLSISQGDSGKVLLRCWAGCRTPDVIAAMGLSWNALFPNGPPPSPAELAKAAREREAKEAQQEKQRQRERAVNDRERKLMAVASELARRLSRMPDGAPEGDALAKLYHSVLSRLPERQIDEAELCSGTDLIEKGPVGIGAREDCVEY